MAHELRSGATQIGPENVSHALTLPVSKPRRNHLARWADVPNVVLTPHMAGGGRGAMEAMTRLTIENLMLYYAGQPAKTPVS